MNRNHIETIKVGDPTRPTLLESLVAVPEWTRDALCAQTDPDMFFPDKGGDTRPAKAVCRRCPVTAECLDYALTYEAGEAGTPTSYAQVGVYGGLAPRQRRALVRARRKGSAA